MESADVVAQRWAAGMQARTDKMAAGADRVTQSPGQAAAARADYWQMRVSSAEAKAKFARRAGASTIEQWRTAYKAGLNKIGTGTTNALPKFTRFLQQFLPYVESGAARVRQMPKGGTANAIARASAMIMHNAAFKAS